MIPMLIFYLIKRFRKIRFSLKDTLKPKKSFVKLKILILFFTLSNVQAHNKIDEISTLTYNVVRNDNVIGTIKIFKNSKDNATIYLLESNITAKFILKFNISGKEKSVFKNGILVYSSVFRKLNNKVKVDHNITYKKGQYKLQTFNKVKPLNLDSIKQNLITLYFEEPIGLNTIFCDNLKQNVKVEKIAHGVYKVEFENGKHNTFYYKKGRCVKIKASSNLFNVTLIPA